MTGANSGFRDFDESFNEEIKGRASFKLAGQTWTCRKRLPFRATAQMMKSMDRLNETDTTMEDVVSAIESFFNLALIKSQREKFIAALDIDPDDENDENDVMGFSEVQQVMSWLMGRFMGTDEANQGNAPSPNGSGSTTGPSSTGPKSKADSLQAAITEVSGT